MSLTLLDKDNFDPLGWLPCTFTKRDELIGKLAFFIKIAFRIKQSILNFSDISHQQ